MDTPQPTLAPHAVHPDAPTRSNGRPSLRPRRPRWTGAAVNPPAPRPSGRIAVLDGLRLGAALLVVAFHYLAYPGGAWNRPTSELFPHLHVAAGYGRFGVELFFMISGFVICMSSWGRTLGDYFTSRVVRLFPAYWFAVLATTAAVALIPGGITPHAWREVLVNLTMLHRPMGVDDVDGVYWTLWAEVRFYIVFALIAWRGLTYRRVVAFCALWSVAAILTHHYTFGPLQALVLPGECWFFIAGLAFYLIRRFGPDLLLWSIVALAYAMGQWQMLDVRHDVIHSLGYSIPAIGVTALITLFFAVMAAVALGRLDRIRWRWLTTAGALTYPLYLLHEYIGWEAIRTLRGHAPPLVLAAGTAAAMLIAAWLVHRLVERPLAPLLKRHLKHSFDRIRTHSQTATTT